MKNLVLACTLLLLIGCCHRDRAETLKNQKDDVCQRARARAVVALYKLRPDSPDDIRAAGVAQALELGEWSTYCDRTASAAIGTEPDIDALRQMLTHFAQSK